MFRKIMAIISVCSMLSLANSNASGTCGCCGATDPKDCFTNQVIVPALLAATTTALAVYAYPPQDNHYVLMAKSMLSSAARSTASAVNEFIFSPLGFASALALGTVAACSYRNTIKDEDGSSIPSNPAPSGSDGTSTHHDDDTCSDPTHHHSTPAHRGSNDNDYFGSFLSVHP